MRRWWAVSPSSVYRVLSEAELLKQWAGPSSRKGTGFDQPSRAHQHWHIDLAYLNICGTFYYLCSNPGRLQPLSGPLGDPDPDDRKGR